MTIVALSAAYGAAGSQIGPALAKRLGVPFVDRGIALAVAERLEVPGRDALNQDEHDEDFHHASRDALLSQAATGAGVILGRGAVAALRTHPNVLRVRLTAPHEARIEHAMRVRELDRNTAERTLHALDRAHADYLRQFYDADIDDPTLYHLAIDSTAFEVGACLSMIEVAAKSLISAHGA